MIGAPAFAILTAHSPGVFPSPSPWGPAKVVMMVMVVMMMMGIVMMMIMMPIVRLETFAKTRASEDALQ